MASVIATDSTTHLSSSPILLLLRAASCYPGVSNMYSLSSSPSQPARSQVRCLDNDSRNRMYEQADAEAIKSSLGTIFLQNWLGGANSSFLPMLTHPSNDEIVESSGFLFRLPCIYISAIWKSMYYRQWEGSPGTLAKKTMINELLGLLCFGA